MRNIHFLFNEERINIQFLRFHGAIHWIFDRPNGTQATPTERDIGDFLQLSPRTLRAWRNHTQPFAAHSLYLAHLYYTGRQIPPRWARKGLFFHGDKLTLQGRTLDKRDLPEWDYMKWLLTEQRKELEALKINYLYPPRSIPVPR